MTDDIRGKAHNKIVKDKMEISVLLLEKQHELNLEILEKQRKFNSEIHEKQSKLLKYSIRTTASVTLLAALLGAAVGALLTNYLQENSKVHLPQTQIEIPTKTK